MATEIVTNEDYKKVEILGLLPTARDPSDWLRMVARIFGAYKQVDLNKSIAAYIDGFDIKVTEEGDRYKFEISAGSCFIDDQFIGFKDDVVWYLYKNTIVPNSDKILVLYYQWSLEFNYNLAEFKVIDESEFVPQNMIRIRRFKINADYSITLEPSDLDQQFADNFKKLFEIASDKVVSSMDSLKYHFESYDVEENKIAPETKSGDFVYLDYITGQYRPARSCTKKYDKAVGIYLKNINNNKQYVIFSGIVNFDESQWYIDDERSYLKNLEKGTSYYLADNCLETNVYTGEVKVINPGAISSKFYPGLVRVGFSIDENSLFIQLDYSSEMNVNNILELFGDKERFSLRYTQFYDYFSIVNQLNKYNEYTAGDYLSHKDLIDSNIDEIDSRINTDLSDLNTAYSNWSTAKSNLENHVSSTSSSSDYKTNFESIFNQYHKKIYNQLKAIYNGDQIKNVRDNIKFILDLIKANIDASQSAYDDIATANTSFETKTIGKKWQALIDDMNDIYDMINYWYQLLGTGTDDKTLLANSEKRIQDIIINYFNKTNDLSTTINNSNTYLDITTENDDGSTTTTTGYISKIINSIQDSLNSFSSNHLTVMSVAQDPNNYRFDDTFFTLDYQKITDYYQLSKTLTWDDVRYYKDSDLTVDNVDEETGEGTYSYSTETDADGIANIQTNDVLFNTTTEVNDTYVNIYDNTSPDSDNYKDETLYTEMKLGLALLSNNLLYINKVHDSLLYMRGYIIEFQKLITYFDNYFSAVSISTETSNIETINTNFNTLAVTLMNKKDLLNNHQIETYTDKMIKDKLNIHLNELNSIKADNENTVIDLSTKMTTVKENLGVDLDQNNPVLSIFSINNYQRIIYNYTYIVQRLRIKFTDKKVIEDRIQIIDNKIAFVTSQPVIDQALLTQLQDLKASYVNTLNQVNFEIETLATEFNRLRTEHLGLPATAVESADFDDGGLAVSNLDCLDTSE